MDGSRISKGRVESGGGVASPSEQGGEGAEVPGAETKLAVTAASPAVLSVLEAEAYMVQVGRQRGEALARYLAAKNCLGSRQKRVHDLETRLAAAKAAMMSTSE